MVKILLSNQQLWLTGDNQEEPAVANHQQRACHEVPSEKEKNHKQKATRAKQQKLVAGNLGYLNKFMFVVLVFANLMFREYQETTKANMRLANCSDKNPDMIVARALLGTIKILATVPKTSRHKK